LTIEAAVDANEAMPRISERAVCLTLLKKSSLRRELERDFERAFRDFESLLPVVVLL
jgi:hypothetical protein